MESNKKIVNLFMSIALLLACNIQAKREPAILPDAKKVLDKVDGFFVNGHVIAQMITVRKGIRKILYGNVMRGHKYQGLYSINSTHYNVKELARMEKTLRSQKSADDTTRAQQDEVKRCLQEAKRDFIKIAEPFLAQANELKSFTLRILNEWAQVRNRTHSLVMKWNDSDDNEIALFNEHVTTCEDLVGFAEDLDDFLFVFTHNVPKSYEQFMKWYVKKTK